MSKLTFAVCSYNRAERLDALIPVIRKQSCPIPFEILIVDNNSSDNTAEIANKYVQQDGVPVRYVQEKQQGIPYARNRAIEESFGSDYMVFIDDDEIPGNGLLEAAYDALHNEAAGCVGGRVDIMFEPGKRPRWLGDELLGFLAEVDHGKEAFWITDRSTPVWTANIGYRMEIFRNDSSLRFDYRYNRQGSQIGGGEDAVMFWGLLERNIRIRYRPDMIVEHYVENWRLKRSYFIKLHFIAGRKYGQYQTGEYSRTILGIPIFFISTAIKQWLKAIGMFLLGQPKVLRQAMNGAHATGMIWGRYLRWRHGSEKA